MKIKEWLEQLPEPYRKQALDNAVSYKLESDRDSMTWALLGAFSWSGSPQGHGYWSDLFYQYLNKAL